MIWKTRQRSDFGSLKAIRKGEGPLLLLLHGVGLKAEAWNRQIEALSAHYSVVAPDMPGHGETPFAGTDAQLSAYTDKIAEALEEPALVAGHSMGALMALDLAIRYPDLVHGVAPLNCIFQRQEEAKKAVQARAESMSLTKPNDPTPTLSRWFDDLQSEEAIACKNWLLTVNPHAYKQAYSVFAHDDGASEEALLKLAIPALFMTGAKEPNSTPAMSEKMASLAPKGTAIIIEGAAHMMPMTHHQKVNDNLLTFFAECRP